MDGYTPAYYMVHFEAHYCAGYSGYQGMIYLIKVPGAVIAIPLPLVLLMIPVHSIAFIMPT